MKSSELQRNIDRLEYEADIAETEEEKEKIEKELYYAYDAMLDPDRYR